MPTADPKVRGLSDPSSAAPHSAAKAAEPVPSEPGSAHERGLGRRAHLTGGAAGLGLGAALGLGGALIGGRALGSAGGSETDGGEAGFGGEELGCHGAHQAGVVTAPGAHIRFLAYRLLEDTDTDALARMFNILTGDIEALTAGEGPLADPEPELAARPARLAITVGVGAGLVERVSSARRPEWLGPLPVFRRDRLGNGYDDGDLLLMVQADDLLPIAHAARMLERDLVSFAEPLWSQQGFRQARGADASGTTMRNLMGQVDGTENPSPEDDDLASLIWLDGSVPGEGWLAGGSALVLRRIRMELDTWDQVDRPGREQTIGRRLSDGSPLSAPAATAEERTPSDFEATNEYGLPLIPSASHIRRAHSEDPRERIFRRAVNYEQDGESGLLFACYQRDPLSQFVPIQGRLDEVDLLNEWITHTGSAVFAILPGFREGGTLGASLFAR